MRTRHRTPVNLLVYPCYTTAGALFTVDGAIDVDSATRLRGSLVRCLLDGYTVIDVDLAGVTFCDSSGLNVFLDISKAAAQTGGQLRLHNPSPTVARLFTLTGTGTILLRALPRGDMLREALLGGARASLGSGGAATRRGREPGPGTRRSAS